MKLGCDIREGASHQRKEPNYDVRELQKRLLGIVVDFDRVCREHQLRYYVTYGSMLGAVRHRGFIPWDDDIDLGMPRDDYDRLIAHSREWRGDTCTIWAASSSTSCLSTASVATR